MKTTVDISDPLLTQAKCLAAAEGTTVRALVEEGLRTVLADRRKHRAFRLRKVTFKGQGLQPGVSESWEELRSMSYEGRGT